VAVRIDRIGSTDIAMLFARGRRRVDMVVVEWEMRIAKGEVKSTVVRARGRGDMGSIMGIGGERRAGSDGWNDESRTYRSGTILR
jgi:hypothetical protein